MGPDGATVWFSRNGQPHFCRPPNDEKQFLDDVDRFNRTCDEVLNDATYTDWSAQRYLDQKRYGEEFRQHYFYPRARGEFSIPDKPPGQIPIRCLVASWRMLGVVGPAAAERMVVEGGMHTYGEAVERWLRERKASLFLSTRVASISRPGDGIQIRAVDRDKASLALSFDHVVIATNANQVIELLEDAAQEEARIYSKFESRRIPLVVHQDPQLLPADRATWGAYNYVLTQDPDIGPTMTVYANRLQDLPASVPDVFVTMNPFRTPDADKIITEQFVVHPVIGGIADEALQKLDAIQGKRRTWFCGGYMREPFVHEQAYRSGVEIADRLLKTVADESLKFEAGIPISPGGFDHFLREVPLFAELDARALCEVQLVARPFQVDAGTMLFQQGDAPDGVYLIKRGEVAIVRRIPGDEVVTLTVLGPRTVVGEMGLLDGNPRSTHAVAKAQTFGYVISSERFQMLRSDYRPAAFAVMNCFRREVALRARKIIGHLSASATAADVWPMARPRSGAAKWPEPSSPSSLDEELLHSLPFFRNFRRTELREFVEPLKRYDFSHGQLVYDAGERAHNCLIVVRGALGLNLATPRGISPFSLHGPGQIVGELALIDGGAHPLACIARETTIAFEVDRIGFDLLCRGGSVMALKFMEAVTSSLVAVLRRADGHMARIAPEQPLEPSEPGARSALEAN